MKYEITRKEDLNAEDYLLEVRAPLVAERFQAGHFVVLITHPKGERIPMSVQKAEDGKITMFIKKIGKTTTQLYSFKVGESLEAVIGPLGNPPKVKRYGNVVWASDSVCAHAENYAFCNALKKIDGNHIVSMQTFLTKNNIYPEKQLCRAVSDEYYLTTLDGSYGIRGHYRSILKKLLKEGKVDIIFAGGLIGKLPELARLTKEYDVPTFVAVHQVMVDATGMCGSCRVFVDGEMKLTCIDGPMFDAHKVDFDALMKAGDRFKRQEAKAMENYNRKRS